MGIALALGIITGVRLAIAQSILFAILLVAGLIVLASFTSASARTLTLSLIVGAVIGLAAGYIHQTDAVPDFRGNARIVTEAHVISDPDQTPRGFSAIVRWEDADGVARSSRLFADAHPRFHRGDDLAVVAVARSLNAEFLYASSVTVTRRTAGLEAKRAELRDWLDRAIRQRVGGSEGALALGLINGDDSAMTERDANAVRRAGLSHITAVSGWNVTLVVAFVGAVLLALRLRGRFWVCLEIIALSAYVWVVGPDAPVIRAAIMAGFVIAARQLGRPAHGPTLITLAAALMIAADPSAIGGLSFQLSILATTALIVSLRVTSRFQGWAAVVTTPLAATTLIAVATAPILAAFTGTFSLASIPANVAAGGIVALTASAALLLVATSWIPIVSTAFAFLTWILARSILWIAALFARLPGGYIEFQKMDGAWLRLAVVVLAVFALIALPEGRFGVWQAQRWFSQNHQVAPVVYTAFAVTTVALLLLTT